MIGNVRYLPRKLRKWYILYLLYGIWATFRASVISFHLFVSKVNRRS